MPTFRLRSLLPQRLASALKLHLRYGWLTEIPPEDLDKVMGAVRILTRGYGFARSVRHRRCEDSEGNAIPWYTYPAIEFLDSLDFSGLDVFEYGCGASTFWWAERAQTVSSVENGEDWYEQTLASRSSNMYLYLRQTEVSYIKSINDGRAYDVIIVDGTYARLPCCVEAVRALRKGGMIVVDNSDLHPISCEFLRSEGFAQIDFNGLVPINEIAGRTSIFFKGPFEFRYKRHTSAVGGAAKDWEDEVNSDVFYGVLSALRFCDSTVCGGWQTCPRRPSRGAAVF